MKNNWLILALTFLSALILAWFGWWWAMPFAGLLAGWLLASGKRGFVLGGLGVTLAWFALIGFYAVTSPLSQLLVVFSGILGLSSSLAFMPVLLALVVAFLLGGMGGLTGGLAAQARSQTT